MRKKIDFFLRKTYAFPIRQVSPPLSDGKKQSKRIRLYAHFDSHSAAPKEKQKSMNRRRPYAVVIRMKTATHQTLQVFCTTKTPQGTGATASWGVQVQMLQQK